MVAQKQPDLSDYFGLRLFAAVPIFLFVAFLAFIIEDLAFAMLVLALAFVKFFDGYIDILVGVAQKSAHPVFMTRTALTRFVILVSVFSSALIFSGSVSVALLALGLAGFIHFFAVEYPWCKANGRMDYHIFDMDRNALSRRKKLAVDGLPIAAAVLIGATQISIVRMFLEHFHGTIMLGNFAATLQIILIGNVIIVASGQAFMPKLAQCFNESEKTYFLKILGLLIGFVIACVICGTLLSYFIGDQLIAFLFGEEFKNLGNLLVVGSLCSLPFFLNAILNQAVIACKLAYMQLYIYVIGLVIACISGWIMTQHYGMNGAYMSILITNAFQSSVFLILIVKAFKHNAHHSGRPESL